MRPLDDATYRGRRATLSLRLRVHVNSVFEQELRDLRMSVERREVQQCPPKGIPALT